MFILAASLLAIPPIVAPSCTTGTWISSADGTPIFELEVANTGKGLSATWSRPTHFNLEGDDFSGLKGPVVHRAVQSARFVGKNLELSFDDPRPGATPDILRLQCVRPNRLDISYQGVPISPFEFRRVSSAQKKLGNWNPTQTYSRQINRSTNAEMTTIFDADQADRVPAKIDWSVVGPADQRRRARTKALLDAGTLQSGDDYYHAAYIFQHGEKPNDYLLAHLLAMIAVARGKSSAIWIVSATLDRYLMNSGKPQVLGTQYSMPKGMPVTQEPYDRTLVSDAMRKALQVPPIPEQEKQREIYARKAPASH